MRDFPGPRAAADDGNDEGKDWLYWRVVSRRRKWLAWEMYVLSYYPEVGLAATAAELPGRSEDAITSAARRLGLRRRERRL